MLLFGFVSRLFIAMLLFLQWPTKFKLVAKLNSAINLVIENEYEDEDENKLRN